MARPSAPTSGSLPKSTQKNYPMTTTTKKIKKKRRTYYEILSSSKTVEQCMQAIRDEYPGDFRRYWRSMRLNVKEYFDTMRNEPETSHDGYELYVKSEPCVKHEPDGLV
jgi:hypothetical protein